MRSKPRNDRSIGALTLGLIALAACGPAGANTGSNALPDATTPAKAAEAGRVSPAAGSKPVAGATAKPDSGGGMTLDTFLDRLMRAESGGRDFARNPLSSALGPFQFIRGTFLYVARRHFAEETADLTPAAILALRTDRSFARRAAAAYTRDNAAHLAGHGLQPTFPHLRLAYLTGPAGAVAILKAEPDARVATLLNRSAIIANPFMARLTARDLIARCARDINTDPNSTAGVAAGPGTAAGGPKRARLAVKCNLALPSCQRWRALRESKLARAEARAKSAEAPAKKR